MILRVDCKKIIVTGRSRMLCEGQILEGGQQMCFKVLPKFRSKNMHFPIALHGFLYKLFRIALVIFRNGKC